MYEDEGDENECQSCEIGFDLKSDPKGDYCLEKEAMFKPRFYLIMFGCFLLVVMAIVCKMIIQGDETKVCLKKFKLKMKKIFCKAMVRRENSRASALKKFKKVANRLRFFMKLGFGKRAFNK